MLTMLVVLFSVCLHRSWKVGYAQVPANVDATAKAAAAAHKAQKAAAKEAKRLAKQA